MKPGSDDTAAQVDHLRRGERRLVHADTARDPLARDRERALRRHLRVERPDEAVLEDHAGNLRRGRPGSPPILPRIPRWPVESSGRRWTLFAVCVTTFMLLVDITIVNVALPSIQRQLGASLTGLQWVVDAYAITLAALILTAGALADRYGRRVVFGIGVARVQRGVVPLRRRLEHRGARCRAGPPGRRRRRAVRDRSRADRRRVPGPERGRAIAVWGSTVGFAVAAGPLLGGLITDSLGWRWIFFVNVPVGAFALVVAMRNVRESRDPGRVPHRCRRAGLPSPRRSS